MDSIILCSEKGRREIVAAKLLSAGITAAIIAVVYLHSYFIGIWIGCKDLSGFDAPIRSLSGFGDAMLNVTAGEMALISLLWLIFVALIFAWYSLKIFNLLGTPVSYGATFMLYVLFGALASLLVFVAQKKRMVSQ